MIHSQISGIGDQKGEQVAAMSILWTTNHGAELFAEFQDGCHGLLSPGFVTFEQHGDGSHLVRIKAFHVDYVEFLSCFNEVSPYGVCRWLERSAEMELSVIDKSDGGGPVASFADSLHELDTDFVIVEK